MMGPGMIRSIQITASVMGRMRDREYELDELVEQALEEEGWSYRYDEDTGEYGIFDEDGDLWTHDDLRTAFAHNQLPTRVEERVAELVREQYGGGRPMSFNCGNFSMERLRRIPFVAEDQMDDRWELEDDYFVDSSGFGAPGEPALTFEQFARKIEEQVCDGDKSVYLSIISSGQFQVYIGSWIWVGPEPAGPGEGL